MVRRSRLDPPKPDIHTLDTYMHRDRPSQDIAIIYSLLKLFPAFSTASMEGQMGQLGGIDRIEMSNFSTIISPPDQHRGQIVFDTARGSRTSLESHTFCPRLRRHVLGDEISPRPDTFLILKLKAVYKSI